MHSRASVCTSNVTPHSRASAWCECWSNCVCNETSPSVCALTMVLSSAHKNLDLWGKEHGVVLFFIEPRKPTRNGQIESFNGRFRAECLDQEWFTSLPRKECHLSAARQIQHPQAPLQPGLFAARPLGTKLTSDPIFSAVDWNTQGETLNSNEPNQHSATYHLLPAEHDLDIGCRNRNSA